MSFIYSATGELTKINNVETFDNTVENFIDGLPDPTKIINDLKSKIESKETTTEDIIPDVPETKAVPTTTYEHIPNAAISGWNRKHMSSIGIEGCKKACDEYEWCNSFDYYKSSKSCDLSHAPKTTPLKTNYKGNPYDHYRKLTTVSVDTKEVEDLPTATKDIVSVDSKDDAEQVRDVLPTVKEKISVDTKEVEDLPTTTRAKVDMKDDSVSLVEDLPTTTKAKVDMKDDSVSLVEDLPTSTRAKVDMKDDSAPKGKLIPKKRINFSKPTINRDIPSVGAMKSKRMPKLKEQDFLALDGNLVLDGVVKATNFIKSDGSVIREVPILKNNYVMPKEIKYNADGTVIMKKVVVDKLKGKSASIEEVYTNNANVVGNMNFVGGNNWTIHTNNAKRRALHIVPSKETNKLDWDWGNQTTFNANGSVEINKLRVADNVTVGESLSILGKSDKTKSVHSFKKNGDFRHFGTGEISNGLKITGTIPDQGSNTLELVGGLKVKNGTVVANRSDNYYVADFQGKGGVRISGHIVGNIPDTRDENKSPNSYRSMGKGQYKEFKVASTIGVNISGVAKGILTTTVPWSDNSGGNIFQDFEASYGGVRYIAKRNENKDQSWTPWVIMTNTGYQTDGLTSGVTNHSSSFHGFRYFKRNGIVHVQGLVKPGSNWENIATLPEGFRPNKRLIFNLNNHENSSRVDVYPDGKIKWEAGGKKHKWISLDGISFPVDN